MIARNTFRYTSKEISHLICHYISGHKLIRRPYKAERHLATAIRRLVSCKRIEEDMLVKAICLPYLTLHMITLHGALEVSLRHAYHHLRHRALILPPSAQPSRPRGADMQTWL